MPQKAIRKPFGKFGVVKLPSALSKREARRLPSATTVVKAAIDRVKDVLHARLHAGTAGAMGHWAKAKACPRKSPSRESSRSSYRSKCRDRSSRCGRYRSRAQNTGSRSWHSHGDGRSVNTVLQVQGEDESFAKVAYHAVTITVGAFEQVSTNETMELQLPNRRAYDTFNLKVDTGAEGNILPLRTYRRMFPRNLNTSGYLKSTEVTHRPEVTLTAYNGGDIKQHGAISLRCRYKNSG